VKPQLQQMMMGDQGWQREQFQAMMKSLGQGEDSVICCQSAKNRR
jgi:hypothetical protein